ncbi:MAG: CAP domain-containing protein, partial [Deltaproteobacteria bacterium]|nr:CAP domain-containing protein [Deltaproteobacteria bacterium]
MELIHLINQARQAPMAMAQSLGVDPESVLEALPELADLLTEGLAPLTPQATLQQTAESHNQDMLENQYYAGESLNGDTVADRIRVAGYFASESGESLGMLAFRNFVDIEDAVVTIFEKMFLDELDPARLEQRNILNPDLTEIGAAIGSGEWAVNDEDYNVYIVTCDFASQRLTDGDRELFALINQARTAPLAVAKALGMKPWQILQDFPELSDILKNGLPPVRFNKSLYLAAESHGVDMLQNDYIGIISSDGSTLLDRTVAAGYPSDDVAGLFRALATESPISSHMGTQLNFEHLFKRELDPDTSDRVMLNPDFEEMGPKVLLSEPVGGDVEPIGLFDQYYINLAVANFGATGQIQDDVTLLGWAYEDRD